MEYRSKSSDIGSDVIGSHGKAPKYDMGGKKTARGSLELDNVLEGYDGLQPKDSYRKQDERFVKNISADLL